MTQTEILPIQSPVKRPVLLGILCHLNWLFFGIVFLFTLNPAEFLSGVSSVGLLYTLFGYLFIYPAILIGTLGMYKLRRWGLYLYALAILIPFVVLALFFDGVPKPGFRFMGIITLILGFIYRSRMR